MVANQAADEQAGRVTMRQRYGRPPEIQTRDSEERRPFRYAAFRVAIRMAALGLVFLEIILIGPTLPMWLALTALIYSVDQIRVVVDTANPVDIVVRPKPNLRHDSRFMGLTIMAIVGEMINLQGVWFPIWFPSHGGYLWWETATGTGRILPQLGALAVWAKMFLLAGLPIGFWDPIKVLDWVYRVESVWTQYRNTQFVQAAPTDIQTPMGELRVTPQKPDPTPEPFEVRLTSKPLPPNDNGGQQVKAIAQEHAIVDI